MLREVHILDPRVLSAPALRALAQQQAALSTRIRSTTDISWKSQLRGLRSPLQRRRSPRAGGARRGAPSWMAAHCSHSSTVQQCAAEKLLGGVLKSGGVALALRNCREIQRACSCQASALQAPHPPWLPQRPSKAGEVICSAREGRAPACAARRCTGWVAASRGGPVKLGCWLCSSLAAKAGVTGTAVAWQTAWGHK